MVGARFQNKRDDDALIIPSQFSSFLASSGRLWEAYDVERDGFISFEPFMKEIMSRGGQRINATSAKGGQNLRNGVEVVLAN